jgi:hypothetical protein
LICPSAVLSVLEGNFNNLKEFSFGLLAGRNA